MIKESRLTIRLIALWVIVIAGLVLAYWSLQNLTVSVIKAANGGYAYSASSIQGGYGMGMGAPYYNPCMQPPMYPMLSSGQTYPGAPAVMQTKEDKTALDKYNQDYQKYTDKLEVDCRANMEKEEVSKKSLERSSFWGDICQYLFSSLLGIGAVIIAFRMVKKSELEV